MIFAKGVNFDLKAQGNKSTPDRTLIKILKSPGLMISASGVSQTIFLSSDLDELCHRLPLLLREKKLVLFLIQLTTKLLL